MTQPSGRDVVPEKRSSISTALWTAFAGHLAVLTAAVTGSARPITSIAAAIACSIVAVAALTGLAPPGGNARRVVTALTGGHVLAAMIMATAVMPSMPWPVPLAALAGAAALGLACLAVGRAPVGDAAIHAPQPLAMAPRVAAIALVVRAVLQHWVDSETALSTHLRIAILLAIAALGVGLLASLSIIALRLRPRWAFVGLVAWTIGWVSNIAHTSALLRWSLGGSYPTGPHQLLPLDAELVRILATLGGLAIGAALVTTIRDVRARHSAIVLLAGYVTFGVIGASNEYQIGLAMDYPSIAALRKHRALADAITAVALAAVLWLYWRRVAAASTRSTTWERDT
jgi:hypothetical protein